MKLTRSAIVSIVVSTVITVSALALLMLTACEPRGTQSSQATEASQALETPAKTITATTPLNPTASPSPSAWTDLNYKPTRVTWPTDVAEPPPVIPTHIPAPCPTGPAPTAPAALITAVAQATPQAIPPPSYWEIRRTVLCIVARYPTPSAYSVDTEDIKDVHDYSQYLRGRQVKDWVGVVRNEYFTQSESDYTYGVTVFMEVPNENSRFCTPDDCYMRTNLSANWDDVQRLYSLMAAHPNQEWFKVTFSGLITGVDKSGQLYLHRVTLEPLYP